MEKRRSEKNSKQVEALVIPGKSLRGQAPASISQERAKEVPLRPTPDKTLVPIVARAIEVIGDRDEALRWLGTPVRGLGYATPISLMGTEEGAARVDDILGQIEHGIW